MGFGSTVGLWLKSVNQLTRGISIMCGVVGIFGRGNVNQALFDALNVLQHRGQDAAGMLPQPMVNFISEKIMVWYVMSLECVTCNI